MSQKWMNKVLVIACALAALSFSCRMRDNQSDLSEGKDPNGGSVVSCTPEGAPKSYQPVEYAEDFEIDPSQEAKTFASLLTVDLSDVVATLAAANGGPVKLNELMAKVGSKDKIAPGASEQVGLEQLKVVVEGVKILIQKRMMKNNQVLASELLKSLDSFVQRSAINFQVQYPNINPDVGIIMSLEPSCTLPEVAVLRVPKTESRMKEFFFMQRYWSEMSLVARIGLVFHEVVYEYGRRELEFSTSENVRKVVRAFSSKAVSNLSVIQNAKMMRYLGFADRRDQEYYPYIVAGAQVNALKAEPVNQAETILRAPLTSLKLGRFEGVELELQGESSVVWSEESKSVLSVKIDSYAHINSYEILPDGRRWLVEHYWESPVVSSITMEGGRVKSIQGTKAYLSHLRGIAAGEIIRKIDDYYAQYSMEFSNNESVLRLTEFRKRTSNESDEGTDKQTPYPSSDEFYFSGGPRIGKVDMHGPTTWRYQRANELAPYRLIEVTAK